MKILTRQALRSTNPAYAAGSLSSLALRAVFRRYLRDFAARCGLALANDGTVPRLFADDWYDDGNVPWEGEEVAKTASSPRVRRGGEQV